MAYATQTDLTNVGLPSQALGQLTQSQINGALQDASDELDSYFRGRYGDGPSPLLLTWDTSVTRRVAQMAAYQLMLVRGYDPNSGADTTFKDNADAAVAWCRDVQRQQAHPVVTVNGGAALSGSSQPIVSTTSVVSVATGWSRSNRGW